MHMSTILPFCVLEAVFYGVCLALFLVEFEAVQGGHQGTNYSFNDCLVSSIFYGRYGMEGLSHTKAPCPSPRPSIQRRPSSVSRAPLFMTRVMIISRLWSCRALCWYYQGSGIYQLLYLTFPSSFLLTMINVSLVHSSWICFWISGCLATESFGTVALILLL